MFIGRVLNPIVWAINQFSNAILELFGIDPERREDDPISREELRTVVMETGGMIPRRHQHISQSRGCPQAKHPHNHHDPQPDQKITSFHKKITSIFFISF